jgi:hypothetical protein
VKENEKGWKARTYFGESSVSEKMITLTILTMTTDVRQGKHSRSILSDDQFERSKMKLLLLKPKPHTKDCEDSFSSGLEDSIKE